jgi:ribosomal protein S18 acetylase RimI-like enzyme
VTPRALHTEATEADLGAVADVLSVSFAEEYAPLFTRDDETRRRCVEALLTCGFLNWRDSTLLSRADGEVVGVAILRWTPRLPRRPVWRCLQALAAVIGWPRAILAMGSLLLTPEQRPERGACELLVLAVHPMHRQRGIARRLVIATEEAARARCRSRVSVAVDARNAPAIALYQSCGFEHTETRIAVADLLVGRVSRYHRMQKSVDLSQWLRASS